MIAFKRYHKFLIGVTILYKDFIKDNPEIIERLDKVNNGLRALSVNVETDNSDITEIIKILEQDPRIKSISAQDDILEIYTEPIIFDLDNCSVSSYIRDRVDDRHKKLNYGEYAILIKPGFMPFVFPYDCSQYNVPPMYRRYESYTFDSKKDMETPQIHREHNNIYNISCYRWVSSEIGKQLGCYRILDRNRHEDEDDDDVEVKYNVLIPHPHVNSEGHVCYGNIKDMLHDAIEANAINFVVNITLDVLFTYNEDNPYFTMWKIEPCSNCPDRYTFMCNGCKCCYCDDQGNECIGCNTFRQPSLYGLFKIRQGLLKLYVYDTRIPENERIDEMKTQTQTLINEFLDENDDDIRKEDLLYYLRNSDVSRILHEDYDEDLG